MSRIVIVGGHGKVALLLAPILAARGDEVISLIRDPGQSADVARTGAAPLALSVETASTAELVSAFDGADAVVWSAGAGGKGGPGRTDAVDRVAAIRSMEAALQAGVPRYVMVSWNGSTTPCRPTIRSTLTRRPRSRRTGTFSPPVWPGRSSGPEP